MSLAEDDDYEIDLTDGPTQPLVTEIAVCLGDADHGTVERVVKAAHDAAGESWRGVAIGNRLFPDPEGDSGG